MTHRACLVLLAFSLAACGGSELTDEDRKLWAPGARTARLSRCSLYHRVSAEVFERHMALLDHSRATTRSPSSS